MELEGEQEDEDEVVESVIDSKNDGRQTDEVLEQSKEPNDTNTYMKLVHH